MFLLFRFRRSRAISAITAISSAASLPPCFKGFVSLPESVSSVFIRGDVFAFPIPAIPRDYGDYGDFPPTP